MFITINLQMGPKLIITSLRIMECNYLYYKRTMKRVNLMSFFSKPVARYKQIRSSNPLFGISSA